MVASTSARRVRDMSSLVCSRLLLFSLPQPRLGAEAATNGAKRFPPDAKSAKSRDTLRIPKPIDRCPSQDPSASSVPNNSLPSCWPCRLRSVSGYAIGRRSRPGIMTLPAAAVTWQVALPPHQINEVVDIPMGEMLTIALRLAADFTGGSRIMAGKPATLRSGRRRRRRASSSAGPLHLSTSLFALPPRRPTPDAGWRPCSVARKVASSPAPSTRANWPTSPLT